MLLGSHLGIFFAHSKSAENIFNLQNRLVCTVSSFSELSDNDIVDHSSLSLSKGRDGQRWPRAFLRYRNLYKMYIQG